MTWALLNSYYKKQTFKVIISSNYSLSIKLLRKQLNNIIQATTKLLQGKWNYLKFFHHRESLKLVCEEKTSKLNWDNDMVGDKVTWEHTERWRHKLHQHRTKASTFLVSKPNIYSCTLSFSDYLLLKFAESNHTILSSNNMNFKCVYLHGKCDSWMEMLCEKQRSTSTSLPRSNEFHFIA